MAAQSTYSIALNGSSGYVNVPDQSALNPAQLTLSCWVYITSYGSSKYVLIAGKPVSNAWGTGGYAIVHHPEGCDVTGIAITQACSKHGV